MSITVDSVVAAMKAQGHVVFDQQNFDMNVVGLRKSPGAPNVFDDRICCFFKLDGIWQFRAWPATTDPGTYWLQHPMNVDGTAIVRPGQYRSSHSIGMHRGEYEAMVQTGSLGIWRDASKDAKEDFVNPKDGPGMGINIHHAGTDSTQVDNWSAGCQVFKRLADFQEFMALMHRQRDVGIGATISYSLLEWPASDMP